MDELVGNLLWYGVSAFFTGMFATLTILAIFKVI